MLVQQSITRKAVLVPKSTIGSLWRLCLYRRVQKEQSGGCAGKAEYQRSTGEAVLVQLSTIEVLGGCAWYRRVLQ